MGVVALKDVKDEFVTPRHSSAFGKLITGQHIEIGLLRYKAGEGASEHAHPHEQITIILKGKSRVTINGEIFIAGEGEAIHFPPNVSHRVEILEDSEVISAKSIVDGVGHRIS
ncbi:MAG: cupin domain-containing protein [Burkholderiales bacterium]|nr:cupin domain-containing protein [Burkholderiales bacterium]